MLVTSNYICALLFSHYRRSELTCCRDEYGEYAAESDSALDSLKIGACEWHFAFYQCPDGYAAAGLCGIDTLNTTDTSLDGYILTPSGSLQIGSAWGECTPGVCCLWVRAYGVDIRDTCPHHTVTALQYFAAGCFPKILVCGGQTDTRSTTDLPRRVFVAVACVNHLLALLPVPALLPALPCAHCVS